MYPMKKVIYSFVLILGLSIALSSCETSSFVKANEVGWSSILLSDGMTYDKSWNEVIDILAKKFEMDVISKDGGYARSSWIYTYNKHKKYTEGYRNRVIIKFSADRSKVDIKTEAQMKSGKMWINGYDSKILEEIKQDISGIVGRVAK